MTSLVHKIETSENLGSEFWVYRFGQFASMLGDACAAIALGWWILDRTGSAIIMSSVMGPALLIRVLSFPFAGALGDRLERRLLVITTDVVRGAIFLILGLMAHMNKFNLSVIIGLYLIDGICTAIFQTANESMIPNLVKRNKLARALQYSQALGSAGQLLGGITGGLLVNMAGISASFLINCGSFLIAAIATALIRSCTTSARATFKSRGSILTDIKQGFIILSRTPLLLRLMMVVMFVNFINLPVNIVLPVLVKEGTRSAPWFLGLLISGIGTGAIIGSLAVNRIGKWLEKDQILIAASTGTAAGLMMLSCAPGVVLPVFCAAFAGAGMAIFNILVTTQTALALPDSYRARWSAISKFLAGAAIPAGLALSGVLVSHIGPVRTLALIGAMNLNVIFMLRLVPHLGAFFLSRPDDVGSFIIRLHPGCFRDS